jgi:hypothetical protein
MNLRKTALSLSILVPLTILAACSREPASSGGGPGPAGGPGPGGGPPGAPVKPSGMPARDTMVAEFKKYQVKVATNLKDIKSKLAASAAADKTALDEAIKAADAKNAEVTKKIVELSGVTGKEDAERLVKEVKAELAELDKMVAELAARVNGAAK